VVLVPIPQAVSAIPSANSGQTAFGLELAEVRKREDATNARRDIAKLARIGVLGAERSRRLERLRELRRQLVHEYATAAAEQVHEAARIVADEFVPLYDAYKSWIRRGFAAELSPAPSSEGTDGEP
jgi:hypothetical protein